MTIVWCTPAGAEMAPRGFVRGKYASRLRTLSFFITTPCALGFRSGWRVTSHIVKLLHETLDTLAASQAFSKD